jgi:AraC-like DNA-binding protein
MKNSDKPTLPARYYAQYCAWLKTIGVNVDALLRAARISPSELSGPEALLRLDQVDALIAQSFEATGRPDLGFDWGRLIKVGSHDILGYALLSSPSLDYAVRLAVRFYRLMTPTFRMRYRRDARVGEMEFNPVMPMKPETLRFHLEGIAVSVHDQVRVLLGGTVPPYDYYISLPQPAYHQRYRETAPARWHFEAQPTPGIRVVLDAELMDRTPAMSDRAALEMAEARCEALLERVGREEGLAAWVLMMLREARDGMPTIEELAHILHITSRTLDRRLRKEGQQFQEMLKRVRMERAFDLLGRQRLSVTQVALQLGYRDVANFTRAFKRDSGMSPTEYLAREAAR